MASTWEELDENAAQNVVLMNVILGNEKNPSLKSFVLQTQWLHGKLLSTFLFTEKEIKANEAEAKLICDLIHFQNE